MEIPDDVRLSDGGAELSANVTSPEGTPMEDVECVVDIKVSGPPPRSPRGSEALSMDDDVSWKQWSSSQLLVRRQVDGLGTNRLTCCVSAA